MIQIGTEGGILPAPVSIQNRPIGYVTNKRDITVGNVQEKALFIGPAERADVIVDFSQYAGQTLILYNDAPAPVPASDPRIDYYTGDPDYSATGGAVSTQPGYGPNTRTLVQIQVAGGPAAPAFNAAPLTTALPAAFAASQDKIIVPQTAYDSIYNTSTSDVPGANLGRIQDTAMAFKPIGGSGAVPFDLQPKSIIEDFTMDYGRMNALIGVEIAHTNMTNQTSIPQGYIDPPTEVIKVSDTATPIGTAEDGTQLWKITHNGVDTHAIHFHMFTVQLVNRVGWDGAIRKPDANEIGWKDTIRLNPLEDAIIALRPIILSGLPWQLPNSVRPLDVTQPLHAMMGFTNIDPLGNPASIMNEMTNFGWEYVWHCHLLGHEENDMMRAMALAVPPDPPALTATATASSGVQLQWTPGSLNHTGFTLQRAADTQFSAVTTFTFGPNDRTFTDSTPPATAYYRLVASYTVGSAVGAYPTVTADSAWSNVATVILQPIASVSPTALSFGNQVQGTPSAAHTIIISNSGNAPLTITNGIPTGANAADFATTTSLCTAPVLPAKSCSISVTFTPTAVGPRVAALQISTNDPAHLSISIPLDGTGLIAAPGAPSGLRATAAGPFQVNLLWTAGNPATQTGYRIDRATGAGAFSTIGTTGNVATYVDTAALDGTSYRYQVYATNTTGTSSGSNTASITTPVAAPSTLVAAVTPQTPLGVVLTWVNTSKTATGITIQRAGNATFTASLRTFTVANTATSFTDTQQLTLNSTYYYRVEATIGTTVSPWSNVAVVALSAPAAPSNLAATNVATSFVTLQWTDNAGTEGGFTIQRATNSGFTQGVTNINAPANPAGGATSFTVTGLTSNTRYYFRVRSFNGAGTSAWVNGLNVTTLR
jgi:FtsP/CotA-like multicopper oxidase with cupredoxin domain